ncbi:MAG: hypothetical protein COB46_13005, partial [Rhodospirillaceae bacterium]
MKVLVVGSGGREHALCWAIAKSPKCKKLYAAPGNAGIADIAECVKIDADDITALVDFAKSEKIDFVVVGPEVALVLGLVDKLEEKKLSRTVSVSIVFGALVLFSLILLFVLLPMLTAQVGALFERLPEYLAR